MENVIDLQLSPEEEEKRKRRRERNREAAQRCRKRKRDLADGLQLVSVILFFVICKFNNIVEYIISMMTL